MIITSLYSVMPGIRVSTMIPYFYSTFGLYICITSIFQSGKKFSILGRNGALVFKGMKLLTQIILASYM